MGKALGKAMSATRRKAKTVSLRMSISRHEKRRGQRFAELGQRVYEHKDVLETLPQDSFSDILAQIEAEDQSIESLQEQIQRLEGAGRDVEA